MLRSKVIEGQDVRAALTYVARHEAEAGIVYVTDTMNDANVRFDFSIPPEYHAQIRYPLALIRQEGEKASARRFFDYLSKPESIKEFLRAGFEILEKNRPTKAPPYSTSCAGWMARPERS